MWPCDFYKSFFFSLNIPITSPFFFFNDTATTEIYTLSLHDALPISDEKSIRGESVDRAHRGSLGLGRTNNRTDRSEEHTSELQSHSDLVCRLLLEKKKKNKHISEIIHEEEEKHTRASELWDPVRMSV